MKKFLIVFCAAAIALSAGSLCSGAKPTQAQSGKEKPAQSQSQSAKEKNSNSSSRNSIESEETDTVKTNNSNKPAVTGEFKNFGQVTSAAHRSVVANTVQNLLQTAAGDAKIGPQVKAVAIEQRATIETTTEAMAKVEKRNKLKTFLIGADYKNLGALRSEYVQTRNRIRQLTRLADQTADAATKTALAANIAVMTAEMNNLNTFITTNSDKFSLFGWFAKLFYPGTAETENEPEDTGLMPAPAIPPTTSPDAGNLPTGTTPQIPLEPEMPTTTNPGI